MKHRLHVPPPLMTGADIVLDADRAHYLTRVLRLARGATVVCFDGAGKAWQATLVAATGKSATLHLDDLIFDTPAPTERLHLVQGLLKGGGMDEVLQKATELGATDLWLLQADRSNLALDAARLERKLAHWQRVIEAAAAQCLQWHLPVLHEPMPLSAVLAALADLPDVPTTLLLDPGAPPLPAALPAGSLALLIGPEGGWTDTERDLANARGARPHGMGSLVLRAETAPLAALAAVRQSRGW